MPAAFGRSPPACRQLPRMPRGGGRRCSIRKRHYFNTLLLGIGSRGPEGPGCGRLQPAGRDRSKRMTILMQTGLGASEAGKSPEEDALQRSGVRLWAGSGPRTRGVASRCDGRWANRQLHMPQDFSDDTSLGHRGDDPQRALLTHRTARHISGVTVQVML